MNGVAVCRKLGAMVVVALSGSAILVATSATPGAAAAGGCAGTAYVTNDDGTVSVITTATSVVSAPITVGKVPVGVASTPDAKRAVGVAITPDGKHAYVTNSVDGTVSVITTATGAVSAPITVGKGPLLVAITPDGKHVYVANHGDGTVSVITTATGDGIGPHHCRQGSGPGGDHP